MTPDLIILSFFIYSFCGWFFESTVCSLYNEGCCINRGFFMGPVCPIYGAGALGSYLLLGSIEHPLLYFLISMCLSCAVEYLTAWALEKRFHARWWDYSDLPFQLHGRICLYGALLFGISCCIVRFLSQPLLMYVAHFCPPTFRYALAAASVLMMAVDASITIASREHMSSKLGSIHEIFVCQDSYISMDEPAFHKTFHSDEYLHNEQSPNNEDDAKRPGLRERLLHRYHSHHS